jgi:DNA-directed RNA polymerase subunit RPC12/RpoP
MRPQTRPMPENTAHLINDPNGESDFDELHAIAPEKSGFITGIAKLLGIPPQQVAGAFSSLRASKEPDYPVTDCRECGKEFRIFDKHYGAKQVMCPACDDEAFAKVRQKDMEPEKKAAAARLREDEQKLAEKREEDEARIVRLVAETLKQTKAA